VNHKKFFYYIVALFVCTYSSISQEEINSTKNLWITSVEKNKTNEYSIILNDLIVIKEIKLKKTKIGKREIINLEFPTYISKHGKAYPQIIALNKQLQQRIIKAITTLTPEKSSTKVEPSFTINKFTPYTKATSSLKVFASVVFENSLEIECRVMERNRNAWVVWPARKDQITNKWIPQVAFTSKEYKKKIEQSLLSKYKTSKVEASEE